MQTRMELIKKYYQSCENDPLKKGDVIAMKEVVNAVIAEREEASRAEVVTKTAEEMISPKKEAKRTEDIQSPKKLETVNVTRSLDESNMTKRLSDEIISLRNKNEAMRSEWSEREKKYAADYGDLKRQNLLLEDRHAKLATNSKKIMDENINLKRKIQQMETSLEKHKQENEQLGNKIKFGEEFDVLLVQHMAQSAEYMQCCMDVWEAFRDTVSKLQVRGSELIGESARIKHMNNENAPSTVTFQDYNWQNTNMQQHSTWPNPNTYALEQDNATQLAPSQGQYAQPTTQNNFDPYQMLNFMNLDPTSFGGMTDMNVDTQNILVPDNGQDKVIGNSISFETEQVLNLLK